MLEDTLKVMPEMTSIQLETEKGIYLAEFTVKNYELVLNPFLLDCEVTGIDPGNDPIIRIDTRAARRRQEHAKDFYHFYDTTGADLIQKLKENGL